METQTPIAMELRSRAKRFAVAIVKLADSIPTTPAGRVIANQVLRSATSAGANYSAACKARSHADFVAKIAIVVEEADETLYWLELLRDAGLVPAPRLERLLNEANELVAIFSASQITARGRR